MAEGIDGGALSFKSVLDNGELNKAIEETLQRVQGFSKEVASSGDKVDVSLEQMRQAMSQIGEACETNEREIARLSSEYDKLCVELDKNVEIGSTEYEQLRNRQEAIKGEISVRRQLLRELQQQSNVLEEEASKMQEEATATENVSSANQSLRQRIRELREEMARLRSEGIDETSAAYKELVNELGRLQDIQRDISAQGSIMANDERVFAGVLSGVQGLVGGFTALQGVMGLVGVEDDKLAKTMLRVQSLMSITIGLQQVAQTLNKDSAFSLVTLTNAHEWWNKLLDIGRGKQVAETAAVEENTVAVAANTTATNASATATKSKTASKDVLTASERTNTVATGANTAAQTANTAASTAGATATIGLAGAFRMLGAAIKSVPVFGWIAAGITALIAVLEHFRSKAKEAQKAGEEFYRSIAAESVKTTGAFELMRTEWDKLGDDLQRKQKYIEDNATKFAQLGVSVKDVADAENLFVKNADAFIQAQLAKAKATILYNEALKEAEDISTLEQQIAGMSDTRRTFATFWSVDEINSEKVELQKQLEELQTTYEDKLVQITDLTQDYNSRMSQFQEEAVEDTQKYVNKLSSVKVSDRNDAFLKQLQTYKTEYERYYKWINSGLTKEAEVEFASLIEQGSSYLEYLQRQRDTILDINVAERTQEQTRQLQQIYDEIAQTTKETVLEAFNNELSSQLAVANTVLDQLEVIAKRREELANDNSDLDNEMKKTLDDAEKTALQQMREETQALLNEYQSYTEKRKQIDVQYKNDMALLAKARVEAETQAEKEAIDATIANRTRQYNSDTRGTGNVEYDELLEQYKSYEQQRLDIAEEYADKIRIAQEMGNEELITALEEAESKALSKLALDMMKASPDWSLLFGDLDKLTTSQLQSLLDKLRNLDGVYLGIEFDPQDLNTIENKIQDLQDTIEKRNPFKALSNAWKEWKNASDKDSKNDAMKNMILSWGDAVGQLHQGFDSVVEGIQTMGFAMSDETEEVLGAISNIMGGFEDLAKGLASSNPAEIFTSSVSIISNVFSLFSRDRGIEKQIKKWQKAVDALSSAYQQLSWEIDKALGTNVYKTQQAAIRNLQEQVDLYTQMLDAERSKKKTDEDKVKEYEDQIAELNREIQDLFDDMANDILQTDASSFADELADALVEAFKTGEDAAKAFEDTVNEVLQNAVVNQLKKTFLEEQLQSALDDLMDAMGYWNGDDFVFDGLTDEEINRFKNEVQKATDNFNEALSLYKDLFADITDEDDDSLTGAVKGVTEETASILAGQMNAIRINQLEATAIMRDQLSYLSQIASNTTYNRYLSKIDRIITLLETSDSTLRSQGLTGV